MRKEMRGRSIDLLFMQDQEMRDKRERIERKTDARHW